MVNTDGMKKTLALVVVWFTGFQVPLLAQVIGTVSAVRGNVVIQRNGQNLASGPDLGMPIENLDWVRTARGAALEINLDARTGLSGRLLIRENSVVQLELSRMRSGQRGTIELLSGSLAVGINRLPAGSSFQVRTQTANMGVRGTEFDVTVGPAGEALLTTSRGQVACEDLAGNLVHSEPGTVVEALADDSPLRTIPVSVSALEQFRREWIAQRIEAFRSQASRAVRQFAQQYQRLRREFDQAYQRLEAQNAVINKWIREHQRGETGGRQESLREKRAIIGPLMSLRRTLFLLERIHFRLFEVREYLDAGALNASLGGGQTVASFYRQFEQDAGTFESRLGRVRFVAKLYALRNDGELPIPGFDEQDFFE